MIVASSSFSVSRNGSRRCHIATRCCIIKTSLPNKIETTNPTKAVGLKLGFRCTLNTKQLQPNGRSKLSSTKTRGVPRLQACKLRCCQGTQQEQQQQQQSGVTQQQQKKRRTSSRGSVSPAGSTAWTGCGPNSKQAISGSHQSGRHSGRTDHSSVAQNCVKERARLSNIVEMRKDAVKIGRPSKRPSQHQTNYNDGFFVLFVTFVERWWQKQIALVGSVLGALQKALHNISPVPWLSSVQQMLQTTKFVLFKSDCPPSWPPTVQEGHVCPSVAALLRTRGAADRKVLKACGFDATGRALHPLADLPAWRVSQLTGHPVGQLDLYRKAFTHVTALPASKEIRVLQSYERLEWLGDSVLELVVRSLLMDKYPAVKEGDLSQVCQAVVSGAMAHTFAMFMGLDRWVLMGAHDMRSGAHREPKVMADVFESLLGALYQDQGYLAAQAFLGRLLNSCIDWEELLGEKQDARAPLARLAHEKRLATPVYIVTATEKRMVERIGVLRQYVTLEVRVGEHVLGRATHWLRSSAQKRAARQALAALERTL